MLEPESVPVDIQSEAFLRRLMRRQLILSSLCSGTFLVALMALPLVNLFAPVLMAHRIGGFPLTWLILGVLFFPFVWAIAWIFIQRSIRMEEEEARSVRPPKV